MGVITSCGYSHVTLWRLMKKGRFPRSIKVSDRATRWRASDVFAWMEERAAQRR
jgi:prophage regulatory protein